MANNERLCFTCKIPMRKSLVKYKNLKLEARECQKCKERIFTEDLAMKTAVKLELMNKLLANSKLTEEDALELGRKVKKGIARRHGLLA